MLQQEEPDETGVQFSVRDFINAAARELNMDICWKSQGLEEIGYWKAKPIIQIDPRHFRLTEVETLLGDATKAREKLGWSPRISFEELVYEMVREDFRSAERDELVREKGYNIYCRNE